MSMFTTLANIFKGDIETGEETLTRYSTDWSLFSVRPSAVVYPRDAQDVRVLVEWVNSQKKKYPELSLTARSAGTDMSGGPLNTGIIVDGTRYMQGVRSVRTGSFGQHTSASAFSYPIMGLASAYPGTFYRDFEKATMHHGLIMPCYPASKDICALGGMVANNGAGERSLKYGQNKDFVQSLQVVLSDGNIYSVQPLNKKELDAKINQNDFEGNIYKQAWELIRDNYELIQLRRPTTSKNAAGYLLWDVLQAPSIDAFVRGEGYFDMTKFFVGAQGTTGIITEIDYKLVAHETRSDLLIVYIEEYASVPEIIHTLMQSDLEMLEMYDDNTFKIGMKFLRDFLKDKGFFGAVRYALRFLPEMFMMLRGGVPKLIVMAEFVSNNENELHKEAEKAKNAIAHLGLRSRIITKDTEEEKFWDFRHDSFKLLTEHSTQSRNAGKGTRTAPFIDDVAVDPKYLPEYLPKLIEILNQYELVYTVAGHVGDGNFHIIPLMDMTQKENKKKIIEICDRVYALALSYGGTITAEHNDGIIRTPYLEQQFGSGMVALFAKVKKIFDPQNIFNPGKKVGGKKSDIEKWMA